MADYGIKVSLTGYDVKTAADYQLLFSSGWPVLKIHAQGSFTVPDAGTDVTIFQHGLNYPPMFLVYDTGNNRSQLMWYPVYMNNTELKWYGAGTGMSGTRTLYYYIFRHDMTKNFTGTLLKSTEGSKTIGGQFGFKIAKPGKNVNSADYRDYVIHSSARSLQIHKMVNFIGTGISWSKTISHGLGYEPFFLLYAYNSLYDRWTMCAADNWDFDAYADSTNVYVHGVPPATMFCAIFKDPYNLQE
jgi:hypothetical protein